MALNRTQSTGGSKLDPGQAINRVDGQQIITVQAANRWGVSPQTLWGVYGTESSFGADTSTSSAGAQGPMQFEPATWRKYGGSRNVQSFDAAMPAAAHYLHDLGADSNPTSARTIAAVNAYNGNGGGSNPNTSYFQSVLTKGSQLSVSGQTATTAASTAGTDSGGGSSLGTPLEIITDLVTGNVSDLAATLAMAVAVGIKDVAVGFSDLVIVPLWHRNQEAIWYYYENCLIPSKGSTNPAWQTIPVNAAFWGFGYALLFTDPESETPFRVASPRKSRIGRHVRRLQSVPARQQLTKPEEVSQRTAKKPPVTTSKVKVNHLTTFNTVRNRPIRVTGGTNSDTSGAGPGSVPGTSAARIETEGEIPLSLKQGQAIRENTQSHQNNSGGGVSHSDSNGNSQGRPAARPQFRRRRTSRT